MSHETQQKSVLVPPSRTCPICHKQYVPTYPSKAKARAAGDAMATEQWVSGICSDACWDRVHGDM